jgi:Na+/H+ antiporter NhaD/arsenite permease-like protein
LVRGGFIALCHAAEEYVSFIVMLGSLYAISGGIAITGDLRGRPATNTAFLAVGAVIANVVGTTGASMLLVRPLLRTNVERHRTAHIPVFFIFVVSNTGGLLTPLGDPPLFLGFLRGVDFFWTMSLWKPWVMVNAILLLIFFVWDFVQYRREAKADIKQDETRVHPLRIDGWKLNLPLMVGVVGCVLAKKIAAIPFPVHELAMIVLSVISLAKTPKSIRTANHFGWFPIVEVAVLFAGIFVCMVPALELLKANGAKFGVTSPWQFFWVTGLLSSALDNAPTYVTIGTLAEQVAGADGFADLAAKAPLLLAAVSCGAVFMGANTYIGNGPNFMVKAIAEDAGYKMPSFFGYMAYAAGILLPVFVLVTMNTLLLIAHGSRRPDANADLVWIADRMRESGEYDPVVVSYLELAEPTIDEGGRRCVEAGATAVIMLPYFLSPGVHVLEDLTEARDRLAAAHPGVTFRLAEPLGRHPKLIDVVRERVAAVTL